MTKGWCFGMLAMLLLGFSEQASAACFQIPQSALGVVQVKFTDGNFGVAVSSTEMWAVTMSCPTKDAEDVDWPKDGKVCTGMTLKVDGKACKIDKVERK